jgi:hypothetical protein
MTEHLITVDGATFTLESSVDLDLLKHRCADAVAAGGASYVDFVTVDGRTVSALLTSRTRLSFSRLESVAPVIPIERDTIHQQDVFEDFEYWAGSIA